MKILILDNYDSFVYNLYQYFGELSAEPLVYRNDKISLEQIEELSPDGIVISPGPGNPENKKDFGVCSEVIAELGKKIPILGVCLGHQGIVSVFGGKIVRAKRTMHGKQSAVKLNGSEIFNGIKNPLKVMRYHSLVADRETFPAEELKITAETLDDNEIFAVEHKKYPIFGVQFHPESIGTEQGKLIIKNFLGACNDKRGN